MSGKIQIVVGGQFGSEGKGHAAAELIAREPGYPLAIRTGGPNAGHTVWEQDLNGTLGALRQYKLRQLPVASVANHNADIAIAAGSLVDLAVLDDELKETGRSVWVDPAATILEPRHAEAEQTDPAMQWGSTCKGIGAARMDRIHRTALQWGDWDRGDSQSVVIADVARERLHDGGTVQIEAAQGYGLGLHTPYYPKTTSADCRAIDALADVGLSPWEFPDATLEIWLVIRPNPIRVAGDSGPLLGETTWEALGLEPERTTVTNKVRRVGAWDGDLVAAAVAQNGGGDSGVVKLWLNMADQIAPSLAGRTDWPSDLPDEEGKRLRDFTNRIYAETGARVWALGTGPDTAILMG